MSICIPQDIIEKVASKLEGRTTTMQPGELESLSRDVFNKRYNIDIPISDIDELVKFSNEVKIARELLNVVSGVLLNAQDKIVFCDEVFFPFLKLHDWIYKEHSSMRKVLEQKLFIEFHIRAPNLCAKWIEIFELIKLEDEESFIFKRFLTISK